MSCVSRLNSSSVNRSSYSDLRPIACPDYPGIVGDGFGMAIGTPIGARGCGGGAWPNGAEGIFMKSCRSKARSENCLATFTTTAANRSMRIWEKSSRSATNSCASARETRSSPESSIWPVVHCGDFFGHTFSGWACWMGGRGITSPATQLFRRSSVMRSSVNHAKFHRYHRAGLLISEQPSTS